MSDEQETMMSSEQEVNELRRQKWINCDCN
jgi:hypothetical protein